MLDVNEVIQTPVAGNADADYDIWQLLYQVANDRNQTIADRAKAIRHMDVVTGEPETEGKTDEVVVEQYEIEAIELGMMEPK